MSIKLMWVGRVISVLIALPLTMSAVMKLIGGAIVTHLRIGEPVYVQIALGMLIWLGLYLREQRLKALIPLRTQDAVDFGSPHSTKG